MPVAQKKGEGEKGKQGAKESARDPPPARPLLIFVSLLPLFHSSPFTEGLAQSI